MIPLSIKLQGVEAPRASFRGLVWGPSLGQWCSKMGRICILDEGCKSLQDARNKLILN